MGKEGHARKPKDVSEKNRDISPAGLVMLEKLRDPEKKKKISKRARFILDHKQRHPHLEIIADHAWNPGLKRDEEIQIFPEVKDVTPDKKRKTKKPTPSRQAERGISLLREKIKSLDINTYEEYFNPFKNVRTLSFLQKHAQREDLKPTLFLIDHVAKQKDMEFGDRLIIFAAVVGYAQNEWEEKLKEKLELDSHRKQRQNLRDRLLDYAIHVFHAHDQDDVIKHLVGQKGALIHTRGKRRNLRSGGEGAARGRASL